MMLNNAVVADTTDQTASSDAFNQPGESVLPNREKLANQKEYEEMGFFSTKPRRSPEKSEVFDVLLDDKVIASCVKRPAAEAIVELFSAYGITTVEKFSELPQSFKMAFIKATSQYAPSF